MRSRPSTAPLAPGCTGRPSRASPADRLLWNKMLTPPTGLFTSVSPRGPAGHADRQPARPETAVQLLLGTEGAGPPGAWSLSQEALLLL